MHKIKILIEAIQLKAFLMHRKFGAVCPLGRHLRALLAEVRSTAYGDLGMKAFLNALVEVSR